MNPPIPLKRSQRTGFFYLVVPQPGKRARWVSTGCTSLVKAREVIASTGVEKLMALHNADALTSSAISAVTTGRKFTFAEVLDEWLAEEKMTGANETAETYYKHVAQFMRKNQCGEDACHDHHRTVINSFINDGKVSASTRRLRLVSLRSFYAYAMGTGRCLYNPTSGLRVQHRLLTFAQREQKPAAPFTHEQYNEVLAKTTGFWHWATVLAWHLGYRMVDIACLELASLADPNNIVVYPSKTGRRLEVSLGHPFIRSDKLMATLDEIRLQATDPVYCFPEQREIRLSTSRRALLNVQFGNIMKRLGYSGYSFHGLRHSFKLRMEEEGLTIERIAGLMGHSSIKQTERYGRAGT